MSTIKVNAIQDTSGVPKYVSSVWVKFQGVTTTTILGSGNVSSVVDGGTGNTQINFANALSASNYAFASGGPRAADGTKGIVTFFAGYNTSNTAHYTTAAIRVMTGPANQTTSVDFLESCVTITL